MAFQEGLYCQKTNVDWSARLPRTLLPSLKNKVNIYDETIEKLVTFVETYSYCSLIEHMAKNNFMTQEELNKLYHIARQRSVRYSERGKKQSAYSPTPEEFYVYQALEEELLNQNSLLKLYGCELLGPGKKRPIAKSIPDLQLLGGHHSKGVNNASNSEPMKFNIITIEVDGSSHNSKATKDIISEHILNELGVYVFRIYNHQSRDRRYIISAIEDLLKTTKKKQTKNAKLKIENRIKAFTIGQHIDSSELAEIIQEAFSRKINIEQMFNKSKLKQVKQPLAYINHRMPWAKEHSILLTGSPVTKKNPYFECPHRGLMFLN